MAEPPAALERYRIIEPFLKGEASLKELSEAHKIATRTLYNWAKAFKEKGLTGLTPRTRTDKGQRRAAHPELVSLIEGLCLKMPRVPVSGIHRTVQLVCKRNGWRIPSYDVIHEIVCGVDPELATFAHQGRKAYKQLFSLIHRFEAVRPNEIWQADHAPLDIFILNEQSKAQQPWITAIVDDYSRAVAGYFIGFQPPSSMRIALALRQAIWRKERSNWVICGIPEKLYSDRGSDFMSNHIEQVSIDLKFERIHLREKGNAKDSSEP